MTDQALPTANPAVHRVRLTSRVPIGEAVVGCTGAKIDPVTGHPHAALDITDGDGAQGLLEVVAGEEIALRAGTLRVVQIHPWNPPHAAGAVLQWVPDESADGEHAAG